ncbi:MAG: hypothetical protein ABIZ95_13870 [Pyrinomonadaceae bacterium]
MVSGFTRGDFRRLAFVFLALVAVLGGACSRTKTATAFDAAAVIKEVRAFTAAVAAKITQGGPIAWEDQFSEAPAFFMVVDDRVVFADRAGASTGIKEVAKTISRLELTWNEPMIIDPITPDLAAVGMPWREVIVDTTGKRVDQSGYFTALAERGPAGWKFRNAHWSVTPIPPTK